MVTERFVDQHSEAKIAKLGQVTELVAGEEHANEDVHELGAEETDLDA